MIVAVGNVPFCSEPRPTMYDLGGDDAQGMRKILSDKATDKVLGTSSALGQAR